MTEPVALRRLDMLCRLWSTVFEDAVAELAHVPARHWEEITPSERHACRAAMRAVLQTLDDQLDESIAQMAAQVDELHQWARPRPSPAGDT